MKKILLMVDVQNDFCPGGTLAVPDGDKVVAPLNAMQKHANIFHWKIVASRDWHPKETSHFSKWPVHCVQETDGAKFHKELLPPMETRIFSKGFRKDEDSYSAFDGESNRGTTLDEYLKKVGATELYIGGLATDYCVRATCEDAVKRGYKVFLLEDCIRAVNIKPDDGAKSIEEMKAVGVIVTTSEAVIGTKK